ncbi:unnamed protein product [Prunus brigantina]
MKSIPAVRDRFPSLLIHAGKRNYPENVIYGMNL